MNKLDTPIKEKPNKKDILDYLRNVQKSTEVKARLSGINIWVLWGALGFIAWAAIGLISESRLEIALQISLWLSQVSLVVYHIFFRTNSYETGEELRFTPGSSVSDTPKIAMVRMFLLGIPFFLDTIFYNSQVGNTVFAVLAFALFIDELRQAL